MLGILLEQIAENRTRLRAVLVEKVLVVFTKPVGALSPGPERRVEGYVAEKVEWISIRLAGGLGQIVEVDPSFLELPMIASRSLGTCHCF